MILSLVLGILIALFLLVLINNDLWIELADFLEKYEQTTDKYGVLQIPITKENVLSGALIKWFAFYTPFLLNHYEVHFNILCCLILL